MFRATVVDWRARERGRELTVSCHFFGRSSCDAATASHRPGARQTAEAWWGDTSCATATAVDGGHCEPGPRNADNFNWPHRLREVGGKHMARRAAVSPGGFYHIRRRFAEVRGMKGGACGAGLTAQRPWKTRLFSWLQLSESPSWDCGTPG